MSNFFKALYLSKGTNVFKTTGLLNLTSLLYYISVLFAFSALVACSGREGRLPYESPQGKRQYKVSVFSGDKDVTPNEATQSLVIRRKIPAAELQRFTKQGIKGLPYRFELASWKDSQPSLSLLSEESLAAAKEPERVSGIKVLNREKSESLGEFAERVSQAHWGLRKGDIVTAINSQPVRELEDFLIVAASLERGESVALSVNRGGEPRMLILRGN